MVWVGVGVERGEFGQVSKWKKALLLVGSVQDQDFTGDAKLQGKDPPPPEDAMATLRACTPV